MSPSSRFRQPPRLAPRDTISIGLPVRWARCSRKSDTAAPAPATRERQRRPTLIFRSAAGRISMKATAACSATTRARSSTTSTADRLANDAFGGSYGINDLGVGVNEICAVQGDSGGPNFLSNGLIAGITSYIMSIPGTWDAVAGTNSSFGDVGADADVSLYAAWIDAAVLGSSAEMRVNSTNRPGSEMVLGRHGRRRRFRRHLDELRPRRQRQRAPVPA